MRTPTPFLRDAGNDTITGDDGYDSLEGYAGRHSSPRRGDDRIIGGCPCRTPWRTGNDTVTRHGGTTRSSGTTRYRQYHLSAQRPRPNLRRHERPIYSQGGCRTPSSAGTVTTRRTRRGRRPVVLTLGTTCSMASTNPRHPDRRSRRSRRGVVQSDGSGISRLCSGFLDSPLLGGPTWIFGAPGYSVSAGCGNDNRVRRRGATTTIAATPAPTYSIAATARTTCRRNSDLAVPAAIDLRGLASSLIDGGAVRRDRGATTPYTRRLNSATNTCLPLHGRPTVGTGVGAETTLSSATSALLDSTRWRERHRPLAVTATTSCLGGLGDYVLSGNDGNDQLIGHLPLDRLDGRAGDTRSWRHRVRSVYVLAASPRHTIASNPHKLCALVDARVTCSGGPCSNSPPRGNSGGETTR